jgi:hypothetical protein
MHRVMGKTGNRVEKHDRCSYKSTKREISRCGGKEKSCPVRDHVSGYFMTPTERAYKNIFMNSIIIAIVVASIVWMALRGYKRTKKKHERIIREMEKKAISRIGTPKTITKEQAERLRKNNFEPMKEWSFEEAELFLDTALYLRAVFSEAAGLNDPPIDMQNALFIFILKDENLRHYMLRWGEERRNRGVDDERVDLSHDAEFDRIAAEALRLTEDLSATSPA